MPNKTQDYTSTSAWQKLDYRYEKFLEKIKPEAKKILKNNKGGELSEEDAKKIALLLTTEQKEFVLSLNKEMKTIGSLLDKELKEISKLPGVLFSDSEFWSENEYDF